jgi:hypothetical protein
MSKMAPYTEAHAATECLQHIEDLQKELQAAIAAITQGSLSGLELSLWRQEMLCVALRRSIRKIQNSGADRESLSRVHSAAPSLHHLNRTYESLVKRSSQSVAFLLGLSCLYKGGGLPAPLPHLSCEA